MRISDWSSDVCSSDLLVREACRAFPDRVVLGIDARGGRVAVEGWAEVSELSALELARRFADAGAAAIVYTDIDRDGALPGANVAATRALAAAIETPVNASRGVPLLAAPASFPPLPHARTARVVSGPPLHHPRAHP